MSPRAQVLYGWSVVTNTFRSLWAEPRAADPPARVWRDWALAAALIPTAILEGALTSDLAWRAVSIALAVALVATLFWRRTKPLVAVTVAFGSVTVVDIAAIVSGVEWAGLNTMVFVLLLPYALFRWGAGREAAIGLAIMLVPATLSGFGDSITAGDIAGGFLVLLFAAALGAVVRFQGASRQREMEHVALREREQLARELHDTVAHHVSAIAVQAQAGRALAASRPDAAVSALAIIEEEASRTLSEMRTMVRALRRGDQPDLAPQPGVADIEQLARSIANGPRVEVELSGSLDDLRPSVDTALYRLAQESITNAVRHARRATRIEVRVAGEPDCVRLTVNDDGEIAAPRGAAATGYGLAGMRERATLLGGTLTAGPGRAAGWTVVAVLPRDGAAR
jgi:signal transduction histidine kinase